MPTLRINATDTGPQLHGAGYRLQPVQQDLAQGTGPVIVMVHGFKFAPGADDDCPHRHILSLPPAVDCWKAQSWPAGLGFGRGARDEGLGIAFGWQGTGTIWQAYHRAAQAGEALAEVINVTSRENDLYDFLLERLVARPERGDTTLGARAPGTRNTLTLQLDDPATLRAFARRGVHVAPPERRVCHWSFYQRDGAFGLYSALLRDTQAFPPDALQAMLPAPPAAAGHGFLPCPMPPALATGPESPIMSAI